MKPPGDAQPSPSAAADSREAHLPASVSIREVGPRDGFQNEPETISTADKVELINALARTGLPRIEVTSFVRAEVIPQLADAEQVLSEVEIPSDVSVSVLIPNERGLERRWRSASGRGLRRGQRVPVRVRDSQPPQCQPLGGGVAGGTRAVFGGPGRRACAARGSISTSFGCPYEGHVPPERVLEIAAALHDAGAEEIAFGDTTGMANPRPGARVLQQRPCAAGLRDVELTGHFHNTRGAASPTCSAPSMRAWRASSRASASSADARCHPARPATSPPRTSSRCSTRWGSTPASIWRPCWPARARAQEILGRPLGSHTLVAGPVDWNGVTAD